MIDTTERREKTLFFEEPPLAHELRYIGHIISYKVWIGQLARNNKKKKNISEILCVLIRKKEDKSSSTLQLICAMFSLVNLEKNSLKFCYEALLWIYYLWEKMGLQILNMFWGFKKKFNIE